MLLETCASLSYLRVVGLMTIPAASQDWEVAVEEGATLVRVGTAVFGPRPPIT